MGSITIDKVCIRIGNVLQDDTFVRWPLAELVRYLSDGQREIAMLRPDATAKTKTVKLVAGKTLQQFSTIIDGAVTGIATALRLLDVSRNMGVLAGSTAGTTPGNTIRVVERRILDAQLPSWHSQAAGTEIKHYMFDLRNPKVWYVYPQPPADLWVEIMYSDTPAELTAPSSNVITDAALIGANVIQVDDIYMNCLVDYAVYRCYSKDAEYTANGAIADMHYKAFVQTLGLKTQSDDAVSPNKKLFPRSLEA